jgi:hypothetical protein
MLFCLWVSHTSTEFARGAVHTPQLTDWKIKTGQPAPGVFVVMCEPVNKHPQCSSKFGGPRSPIE